MEGDLTGFLEQFELATAKGDRDWLYVVENASDPRAGAAGTVFKPLATPE